MNITVVAHDDVVRLVAENFPPCFRRRILPIQANEVIYMSDDENGGRSQSENSIYMLEL